MHYIVLKNIIEAINKKLILHSESATNLILGTCAIESHCGEELRQYGFEENHYDGGFGIGQMEMKTHTDDWNLIVCGKDNIKKRNFFDVMASLRIDTLSDQFNLMYNIPYAVGMIRLHYWRFPEELPEANDIEGLGKYWKKYYNTVIGKGTVKEFIEKFNKYILKAF